jgi:hypothetical protein
MPFELIITSLVGLFSGVISLFKDPKEFTDARDKRKHITLQLILLGFMILSASSTLFFGCQKEQKSKLEEVSKNSQIKDLSDNLSQVNKQNSELLQTVNKMSLKVIEAGKDTKFILTYLKQSGWSPENLKNQNPIKISQSLKASKSLITINENIDKRRSITVEYYPKNVDPTIIRSRLEALGLSLNTPTSKLPEVSTNAIWFGSEVDTNTVKAVAYTLIGAGVELKMIRRLNNSEGREKLIQVGGAENCSKRPTLKVEKIRTIKEFPLQSAVQNCKANF